MAASQDGWKVELDSEWDVLGPFPIHAREQHFISPSFPLNLSESIDYRRRWPSSYADGGTVGWSKATISPDGFLDISFPDIRWKSLRATEGWAALQHHAVLRTTLTIFPSKTATPNPRLLIELKQGSYFTLRPQERDGSDFIAEWYAGNIYAMEQTLGHSVELPNVPSSSEETKYDLFVSGDYEIRLFGDPNIRNSEIPVQQLSVTVEFQDRRTPIILQPSQNEWCDFADGYAFGNYIGVGIQSISGWWTVSSVEVDVEGINLKLSNAHTIAPTQTRIIPFFIEQTSPFFDKEIRFKVIVTSGEMRESLSVSLPLKHHRQLHQVTAKWTIIRGSYLTSGLVPTTFLVIPPSSISDPLGPPILALHGAGVDIFGQDFWSQSLPENKHSWMIIPSGRTSWGLDWHGPSSQDAWASLDAVRTILDGADKFGLPESTRIHPDAEVIIIGHSNGGQGTWYMASRYPDKVLAAIPAAGYIKSQAYIPLHLARSGHFIDPSLRSILEASLTPDDNDLHVSNLVDIHILAIHGGSDENVPVWHTREAVGILKTWYPSHNVTFQEDPGEGHWYPTVFKNPTTQSFLDGVTSEATTNSRKQSKSDSFTLTVSVPQLDGPLRGWKVEELKVPGRIGRVHVQELEKSSFVVETSNIDTLTVPLPTGHVLDIEIDGQKFEIHTVGVPLHMHVNDDGEWEPGCRRNNFHTQPPGRIQSILSTAGPISIIISDALQRQEFSVALRIAHILLLYHRLDSEIVTESIASERNREGTWGRGNAVFIGQPSSSFAKDVLGKRKTEVSISEEDTVFIGKKKFTGQDQALIFTHPHPSFSVSVSCFMLMMLYHDGQSLERAARLFPFRTGIMAPDWVVVGDRMDAFGAAGIDAAGVWTADWKLSETMSWFGR